MDQPQEYDDPNATISSILERVRETGNNLEFPPSKLKSGWGDPCIRVLDILAKTAINATDIKFALPEYPKEEGDEMDIEEANLSDDEDLVEWLGAPGGGRTLNKLSHNINDENEDVDSEFEEENILDLNALGQRRNQKRRPSNTVAGDLRGRSGSLNLLNIDAISETGGITKGTPSGVLESNTDSSEWSLEVERVLPRLKVTIRSESKDWRTHVNQMRRHQTEIEAYFKDTRVNLTRLREDLTRSLDKIQSREKYMNTQLEPLLTTYRSTQDQFSEVKEKYRHASTGITERSRALSEVTEELDRVKSEMDERGSSMTDGSPVVRIKQAIQRLKTELVAMDIRTGVLEHILLRVHLRARENSQKPLLIGQHGHNDDGKSGSLVY